MLDSSLHKILGKITHFHVHGNNQVNIIYIDNN